MRCLLLTATMLFALCLPATVMAEEIPTPTGEFIVDFAFDRNVDVGGDYEADVQLSLGNYVGEDMLIGGTLLGMNFGHQESYAAGPYFQWQFAETRYGAFILRGDALALGADATDEAKFLLAEAIGYQLKFGNRYWARFMVRSTQPVGTEDDATTDLLRGTGFTVGFGIPFGR